MRIIIDIPEELYKFCSELQSYSNAYEQAIANGVPYSQMASVSYLHQDSITKSDTKL